MHYSILLLFSIPLAITEDAASLCAHPDAQLSCGQCIKQHAECAWCIDPHSPLSDRCQLKSNFTKETCTPHLVYAPQSAQVKVQQDLPLEAKQHDGKTLVRLQPQAVTVRLMPGHSASVTFKYLHHTDPNRRSTEPEMMEIQTSEFKDTPLKLKFFITCEGAEKETKTCKVQNNQIVEFRIEAHLESCSTNGDITMSIGVRGQRTIAGLYVTAVCGCECEKHPEMNSRLCHQYGHLVCGQCVCDATRGGDKCECPLALHGVANALALEEKCRFNTSSPTCNGSGKCECGQCRCAKPTISGKFCQCDNSACAKNDKGQLCSGNGVCDCGTCKCEMGWQRDDCSCSSANNNCIENGEMCSNNGRCECNRCVCIAGKTGAFCGADEEPATVATSTPEVVDEADEDKKEEDSTTGDSAAEDKTDEQLEKELDDAASATAEVKTSSAVATILPFVLSIVLMF